MHVGRDLGRLTIQMHRQAHHETVHGLLADIHLQKIEKLCGRHRVQGRCDDAQRIGDGEAGTFQSKVYSEDAGHEHK